MQSNLFQKLRARAILQRDGVQKRLAAGTSVAACAAWYVFQCLAATTCALFVALAIYAVLYARFVPVAAWEVALPFEPAAAFSRADAAELLGGSAGFPPTETRKTRRGGSESADDGSSAAAELRRLVNEQARLVDEQRRAAAFNDDDDGFLLRAPAGSESGVFFFAGHGDRRRTAGGSQAKSDVNGAATSLTLADFTAISVADFVPQSLTRARRGGASGQTGLREPLAQGSAAAGHGRSGRHGNSNGGSRDRSSRGDMGVGGASFGDAWTAGALADDGRARLSADTAAALAARARSSDSGFGWFGLRRLLRWLLGSRSGGGSGGPLAAFSEEALHAAARDPLGGGLAGEGVLQPGEEYEAELSLSILEPALHSHTLHAAGANARAGAANEAGASLLVTVDLLAVNPAAVDDVAAAAAHAAANGAPAASADTDAFAAEQHARHRQQQQFRDLGYEDEDNGGAFASGSSSSPSRVGGASTSGSRWEGSSSSSGGGSRFPGGGAGVRAHAGVASRSSAWTQPQLLELGVHTVLARCRRRVIIPPRLQPTNAVSIAAAWLRQQAAGVADVFGLGWLFDGSAATRSAGEAAWLAAGRQPGEVLRVPLACFGGFVESASHRARGVKVTVEPAWFPSSGSIPVPTGSSGGQEQGHAAAFGAFPGWPPFGGPPGAGAGAFGYGPPGPAAASPSPLHVLLSLAMPWTWLSWAASWLPQQHHPQSSYYAAGGGGGGGGGLHLPPNAALGVLEGQLTFYTRMQGAAWAMHHWFWTTALLCISAIAAWMLCCAVCCSAAVRAAFCRSSGIGAGIPFPSVIGHAATSMLTPPPERAAQARAVLARLNAKGSAAAAGGAGDGAHGAAEAVAAAGLSGAGRDATRYESGGGYGLGDSDSGSDEDADADDDDDAGADSRRWGGVTNSGAGMGWRARHPAAPVIQRPGPAGGAPAYSSPRFSGADAGVDVQQRLRPADADRLGARRDREAAGSAPPPPRVITAEYASAAEDADQARTGEDGGQDVDKLAPENDRTSGAAEQGGRDGGAGLRQRRTLGARAALQPSDISPTNGNVDPGPLFPFGDT